MLDLQGNEHEVRDALGRAVMRYSYAMIGGQVARAGMDTGGGRQLPDVLGKVVYAGTPAGFWLRTEYDAFRRPCALRSGPGIKASAEGLTEYGESTATRRPGTCGPGGPVVRRGGNRHQLDL